MEFDALSAGIGSLINSSEIKILICYVLDAVKTEVNGQKLAGEFHMEGIANYFEVIEAIEDLLKRGNIEKGDTPECYRITPDGADAAKTLCTSLPFTIKEKAIAVTSRMVARLRNAEQTKIEIVKENGRQYIVCSAVDSDMVLMSVKLMVADDMQARYIKDKFLDNPSEIYSKIVDLMT